MVLNDIFERGSILISQTNVIFRRCVLRCTVNILNIDPKVEALWNNLLCLWFCLHYSVVQIALLQETATIRVYVFIYQDEELEIEDIICIFLLHTTLSIKRMEHVIIKAAARYHIAARMENNAPWKM